MQAGQRRGAAGICLGLMLALLGVAVESVQARAPGDGARAPAMGGAGLALPDAGVLSNPAAAGSPQHFTAALGARLSDPDDLIGELRDFRDSGVVGRARKAARELESLQFDPSVPIEDFVDEVEESVSELAQAGQQLQEGLELLEQRPAIGEGGASVLGRVDWAEQSLVVSVRSASWVYADALFEDEFLIEGLKDLEEVDRLIERGDWEDIPNKIEESDFVALEDGSVETKLGMEDLDSRVRVRGVSTNELGITGARRLELGAYPVTVGARGKVQQVYTYDYEALPHRTREWDFYGSDYRRAATGLNLDLGAQVELGERWHLGLAAEDLRARDLDTVRGETFKMRPRYRAGLGYSDGRWQAAVDYDLSARDWLGESQAQEQFLGLGAAVALARGFELRGGYRRSVEGWRRESGSLGLGWRSSHGWQIDAALLGAQGELGAILQLLR